MEALFAVAGLVGVAAITPGPNNFIVLEQALRGGFRVALPAIAGIVAGTQVLLLLIWLGLGILIAQEPSLKLLLTLGGATYLVWLGISIIGRSFSAQETDGGNVTHDPRSFGALFLFQFLNPKSWVLVTTATASLSAADASDGPGFVVLALLFLAIPVSCLSLWALMGISLMRFLDDPARKRWFDRGMGALLVVFAGLLFS